MHEHLLHHLVEKVLFLWVRPGGQDLFEVVHQGLKHRPVDGRELQALLPSREFVPLGLQRLQAFLEVGDLLTAEFRVLPPSTVGVNVVTFLQKMG